jgi:hypothetical protein
MLSSTLDSSYPDSVYLISDRDALTKALQLFGETPFDEWR